MTLLRIGSVAKQLDCSPSTVRRLPIPYVRWPGGHRRYKQEEVDRFMRSLTCGDELVALGPKGVKPYDSGLSKALDEIRKVCR